MLPLSQIWSINKWLKLEVYYRKMLSFGYKTHMLDLKSFHQSKYSQGTSLKGFISWDLQIQDLLPLRALAQRILPCHISLICIR